MSKISVKIKRKKSAKPAQPEVRYWSVANSKDTLSACTVITVISISDKSLLFPTWSNTNYAAPSTEADYPTAITGLSDVIGD